MLEEGFVGRVGWIGNSPVGESSIAAIRRYPTDSSAATDKCSPSFVMSRYILVTHFSD